MDLFKLLGTIAVDNSEANKALDETGEKGKKAESKLSKGFKAIGKGAVAVGKTVGAGMLAAGTAVTALATKSIQSYADYEQLVGGVDTLFKNSSAKVQEYAANAFKTAGMSANDYMETVTGFSASLLQSLGGDTEAAAEKANMAITDMSDNANKMGTDMTLIQNAYQGFAKQNYTMLDNLKLGYGGTQEEMARLLADATAISGIEYDISSYADVVDAIHVIQSEMGITGTTAKEASSTISGSISSMKSSWQNLLTAISSDDLPFDDYVNNFVDSVSTVADNLLPRIEIALNGVVALVGKLAPMLVSKIPELVATLLPPILNAATGLLGSIVAILPSLIDMLVNTALPQLLTGIVTIFNALVAALPSVVQSLVAALPTLIPQLVNGLVSMIVTLCTMLPQIIQPIIDYLPQIIISLVDALMQNLPALIEGCVALIVGLVAAMPQIILSLIQAIPTIVTSIVDGLIAAAPILWDGVKQIWDSAVEVVKTLFSAFTEWFSDMWNTLKSNPALSDLCESIENIWNEMTGFLSDAVENIKTFVTDAWESIKNAVTELVTAIKESVEENWDSIKAAIDTVLESIKTVIESAWETIKTVVSNVMNVIKSIFTGDWEGVKEGISNIVTAIKEFLNTTWNAIKNSISSVMDAIKNVVSGVWNRIKDSVMNVVNNIKTALSSAWNGIKTTASKAWNDVLGAISNVWNGIKKSVSNAVNSVKSAVSTAFNSVKNTVSNIFNSVKNTVSNVWNGILNAIKTPIEKAKNAVKSAIDGIKGFFNFEFEWPKLKMPHFGIKPKGWKIGDLLEGSIPTLGIEWYAKAMNNPIVMTKPTIWGYNPANGTLQGGGEAGTEVVSGANTLMNMIRAAVSGQNEQVVALLTAILEAILGGNQEMLQALLAGHTLKIGEREFGRLVKEYA